MKHHSLSGEALKSSSFADAENLSRLAEKESFHKAKKMGFLWNPTRVLLEQHIQNQIDDIDQLKRKIRFLSALTTIQIVFIILVVVFIIFKRR